MSTGIFRNCYWCQNFATSSMSFPLLSSTVTKLLPASSLPSGSSSKPAVLFLDMWAFFFYFFKHGIPLPPFQLQLDNGLFYWEDTQTYVTSEYKVYNIDVLFRRESMKQKIVNCCRRSSNVSYKYTKVFYYISASNILLTALYCNHNYTVCRAISRLKSALLNCI